MRELAVDTNVLVTALRSRRGASYRVIRLIGTDAFRPNVSVALARGVDVLTPAEFLESLRQATR